MNVATPPHELKDDKVTKLNRTNRSVKVAAIIIILLILGGIAYSYNQYLSNLSYTPITGLELCPPLTPQQKLANDRVTLSGTTNANYDEQLLQLLQTNLTSIQYNVNAIQQYDTYGNSPYYLVNGRTLQSIWYQVGVRWTENGLLFIHAVSNITSYKWLDLYSLDKPQYLQGSANNDLVSLSLSYSNRTIVMKAIDLRTKASQSTTFNSFGTNEFVSFTNHGFRAPTSVMTEWYHTLPYFCSNNQVIFSNPSRPQLTALMRIDELNNTGRDFNKPPSSEVFSTTLRCFYNSPSDLYQLRANGTVVYSNSTSFVTM